MKKFDNNYHDNSINYINISLIDKIIAVIFSLDFIFISIRLNSPYTTLIKELAQHLKLFKKLLEKYSSIPIMKGFFKERYYFDLGDCNYACIWVNKDRKLSSWGALIKISHPLPSSLEVMEKILDRMKSVEDYWISKLEPTFDILTEEPCQRNELQSLIKQTLYIRHGREAFSQGEDEVTDYINLRTSVKQTRVYQKYVDDNDDSYEALRFEIPFKRKKLFSHEIIKPSDILKYDLRIIDEISFFVVDEVKMKRSLLDYDTGHFFSRRIARFVSSRGFHSAQLWSRRIKECPAHCEYRFKNQCGLTQNGNKLDKRDNRFQAIQECEHAKFIANFRSRYCREIEELIKLKDMMFEAFETWKSS